MEIKEVGIARGNEAGFTVDGKFFVVPGIAARMDRVACIFYENIDVIAEPA